MARNSFYHCNNFIGNREYKMNESKIVEIQWIDSLGSPEVWEDIDNVKDDTSDVMITVGYLLKESKRYYILCMSQHNNDTCKPYMVGTIFRIPKGCVKKIRKLK
jgi:hypothetical protein